MPPPPLASLSLQGTTIVVDGSGSTPNAQPSITIAANMAVAGDTILVTPMTDSVSGLPVGYTETNFFSIPNGNESFPISIKQGVTIAGSGGPAHVYSTNLATPPELFKVGGGVVRIGNFQLLGSKTGIEVRGSTDLTVQKVTFANSTTGLDAELLGSGLMKVQVVDCLVTGQLPTLANPLLPSLRVLGSSFMHWRISPAVSLALRRRSIT